MIPLDSASKHAHLDILPKTKLLNATKTATQTHTQTQPLVVVSKIVQ